MKVPPKPPLRYSAPRCPDWTQLLLMNALWLPPYMAKQEAPQDIPGRGKHGLAQLLFTNATPVSALPADHIAKPSSPVCEMRQPSTRMSRCAPWMFIPSAQVPPPPLPSAAAGLHGPGCAQLPVTTRLRTVMFVHCGGGGGSGGGGGGSGGLPGLSQVLNAPAATHLAGTQDDRRQQPLSTPLLAEAFADMTTQWHPFVASQRA